MFGREEGEGVINERKVMEGGIIIWRQYNFNIFHSSMHPNSYNISYLCV